VWNAIWLGRIRTLRAATWLQSTACAKLAPPGSDSQHAGFAKSASAAFRLAGRSDATVPMSSMLHHSLPFLQLCVDCLTL
jgi:hypothetical protein